MSLSVQRVIDLPFPAEVYERRVGSALLEAKMTALLEESRGFLRELDFHRVQTDLWRARGHVLGLSGVLREASPQIERDLYRRIVDQVVPGNDPSRESGWPLSRSLLDYYSNVPDPALSNLIYEVECGQDARLGFGSILALHRIYPSEYDVVISLCRTGTEDVADGVSQFEFWLNDESVRDSHYGMRVLQDAVLLGAELVSGGRNVFVHCAVGRSRSPAVVSGIVSLLLGWEILYARAHLSMTFPHVIPLLLGEGLSFRGGI